MALGKAGNSGQMRRGGAGAPALHGTAGRTQPTHAQIIGQDAASDLLFDGSGQIRQSPIRQCAAPDADQMIVPRRVVVAIRTARLRQADQPARRDQRVPKISARRSGANGFPKCSRKYPLRILSCGSSGIRTILITFPIISDSGRLVKGERRFFYEYSVNSKQLLPGSGHPRIFPAPQTALCPPFHARASKKKHPGRGATHLCRDASLRQYRAIHC